MRLNYYQFPEGIDDATRAKNGGRGWTCHIDRDGGCFETTEITLKGNNSRFKYNRHL